MTDINSLCNEVCAIAREAGNFIRQEAGKIRSHDVETKSLNSLVTYVDTSAEEMIVGKLQALLPEAGFITEEDTISKRGDDYKWVVDPLDGTTNFIHGIPVFSVSIALMKGEGVILGVVYEVNGDECFHAVRGQGAFLNGRAICVSGRPDLSSSLLATGFPYYDYDRMDSFVGLLTWCMMHTRGLRRLGSAAADLAYVACGRFEGFFEYGLNAWDVAAGSLIVAEAGGMVSDFNGGSNYIFGREIVATNKNIYHKFIKQTCLTFGKKNCK